MTLSPVHVALIACTVKRRVLETAEEYRPKRSVAAITQCLEAETVLKPEMMWFNIKRSRFVVICFVFLFFFLFSPFSFSFPFMKD